MSKENEEPKENSTITVLIIVLLLIAAIFWVVGIPQIASEHNNAYSQQFGKDLYYKTHPGSYETMNSDRGLVPVSAPNGVGTVK